MQFYKLKDVVLTVILTVFLTGVGHSQDPMFSQFYANPIYLNPALAGSNVCPRLIFNYRNQWPNIPETFVTYSASYDQYAESLHGSIGVIAMQDKAGVYSTLNVGFAYAYKMQLSESFFINAALQANCVNSKADFSSLTLPDQYTNQGMTGGSSADQSILNHPINSTRADFSAGIVAYGEDFYGGLAVAHLTSPTSSLQMKVTAHAGMVIDLKERRSAVRSKYAPTISPNIMYQRQGASDGFFEGFYVNLYPVVFGTWLHHSLENLDALTFLVGIQQDFIRVGYSYDLTISKLGPQTGGAHEISIAVTFRCPDKKAKYQMIKCPTF